MLALLRRYLRPYVWQVVGIALLLFLRANASLALPGLMAQIVNQGIQAGGVTDPFPEALRASTWQALQVWLSPEDQRALQPLFRTLPVEAARAQGYPNAREPLYVPRPDLTPEAREAATRRLVPALALLYLEEQAQRDPQAAARLARQVGLPIQPEPNPDPATRAAWRQALASLPWRAQETLALARLRVEYQALGVDLLPRQMRLLARLGGWMLLLALVAVVAAIAAVYGAARVAAGVARDVRHDLFAHILRFSAAEFSRFSPASLITRTTNDVMQVQRLVFIMLRMLVFAPALGLGGVVHALLLAPYLGWTLALAVALSVAVLIGLLAATLPHYQRIQELTDALNRVLRENLSGLLVIRAFTREPEEMQRFDQVNRELTLLSRFVNRVTAAFTPIMILVLNGLFVLILWVGAHKVAAGVGRVGDLIAFLQYTLQVMMAFMMLTMLFVFLPRAAVSGKRIMEVLTTEPSVKDPPHPKPLPEPLRGEVTFEHVSFRYPGAEADVLHDISFVARPGQLTAIIGTTGSGKTTLVHLIPRFYDVTEGAVRIDGVDVREVRLADLRRLIAYVPQRGAALFSGTVAENLRMADPNADEEQLVQA
ncbi:MAG: ABC transporter ATP-binding protein, partial [Chloroflexi bacterium]|nr:ABC transporter ATP-binding protein [Chloroflexota bacterium]